MKTVVFDGEKLLRLRRERNISQKQLAEMTGLHKTTISHWESNRVTVPNKENLEQICKILGISESELFVQADIPEAPNETKTIFDGGMLRFLRESHGYSQNDLAVKIGLKGGGFTISKMESGVIGCKKVNIAKLAALFGVEEDDFYKKKG